MRISRARSLLGCIIYSADCYWRLRCSTYLTTFETSLDGNHREMLRAVLRIFKFITLAAATRRFKRSIKITSDNLLPFFCHSHALTGHWSEWVANQTRNCGKFIFKIRTLGVSNWDKICLFLLLKTLKSYDLLSLVTWNWSQKK